MWKNGANNAIDITTWGNSNANVNSNVLIRIDSGGDQAKWDVANLKSNLQAIYCCKALTLSFQTRYCL